MDKNDLREGDNETLKSFGILEDWQRSWELEFHKIKHIDKNQERWSLSKRSFFMGYLLGRNKDSQKEKGEGQ